MRSDYSAASCRILELLEENNGKMSYTSLIENSPIGRKTDTARVLVFMLKEGFVKGAIGTHCQISVTSKGKRELFAHRIEGWYWRVRVALMKNKIRR